jgi:hypothetical protein
MTLDYYPWWLDQLADDVTGQGAFIDGGPIQGHEAVRSVVTAARGLYEFQDFSFTGDYGDIGFLEEYTTQVRGEPLSVVVTVTRNAAGEAQTVVVNHRPRNAMLRFSRLMYEEFADTPLAKHFLADGALPVAEGGAA